VKLHVCICVFLLGSSAALAQHSPMLPAGPLSTNGNQIVDQNGDPVRLFSVGVLAGWPFEAARVADAGFNTIRVQWSNRSLPDRLPELDHIVASARRLGLRVILDDHFNEGQNGPCWAQQANGLWYDKGGATDDTDGCHTRGIVSDAKFIADWETVARHFRGVETVIGYDLWNEPLAYDGMSTWEPASRNPTHNIRWMYERVGNAILTIDPDKLIICAGPMQDHNTFADRNWPAPWGDLSMAGRFPVNLIVAHKLVYTVHDYPAEIGGFQPDNGPMKVAGMNRAWGYLVRENIAPVWIGEMASNMMFANDTLWASTLSDYANGRLGVLGGPTFSSHQQGIGINWWWAGHDPHSGNQPSGIFTKDGAINARQRSVYARFAPQPH